MQIPGLVDLQVNGYKGVDFSGGELTEESFCGACREIVASGTTAFLATMITSSREIYERNLGIISRVIAGGEFAGVLLGVHLEGPFICGVDGARGAHCAEWVCGPDVGYLEQLLEWAGGHVKMITVAAELDGVCEVISYASQNGIAVSLGHQMAGAADLERARQAGAVGLTHLGNGVAEVLGRHENPIWAGLGDDGLSAMIITDGHHLPDGLIKTFIRAKGVGRIIVTSDASPIAGLEPGRYETLGNVVVLADDGKLFNPDTGYMVGSSATMADCMNYLAGLGLLGVEELLDAGFYNPLRLIGVEATELRGMGGLEFNEGSGAFKRVRRS